MGPVAAPSLGNAGSPDPAPAPALVALQGRTNRRTIGLVAGALALSAVAAVSVAQFFSGPKANNDRAQQPAPVGQKPPGPGDIGVIHAPEGQEVLATTEPHKHADLVKRLRARDGALLVEGRNQGWLVLVPDGTRVRVIETRDHMDTIPDGPEWSQVTEVQVQEGPRTGQTLFVFTAAIEVGR